MAWIGLEQWASLWRGPRRFFPREKKCPPEGKGVFWVGKPFFFGLFRVVVVVRVVVRYRVSVVVRVAFYKTGAKPAILGTRTSRQQQREQ